MSRPKKKEGEMNDKVSHSSPYQFNAKTEPFDISDRNCTGK
ncbi:hypothetical protein [Spirosoma spitsbergense]|nr:hypothetical protein [Spirosoma spitsbergense]